MVLSTKQVCTDGQEGKHGGHNIAKMTVLERIKIRSGGGDGQS